MNRICIIVMDLGSGLFLLIYIFIHKHSLDKLFWLYSDLIWWFFFSTLFLYIWKRQSFFFFDALFNIKIDKFAINNCYTMPMKSLNTQITLNCFFKHLIYRLIFIFPFRRHHTQIQKISFFQFSRSLNEQFPSEMQKKRKLDAEWTIP